MTPFTNREKLDCARRELAMRRSVYPRWVASGKMRQTDADREVATMAAIVADYAERAGVEDEMPLDRPESRQ